MTFALTEATHLDAPVIVTEIPGPRSAALHAERTRAVTDGFGVALPVFIDHADGAVLVDVDGNRFIDLASGIAVTSVGAAHPRVAERVAAQAARFTHTCFMVTEYESFIRVAEWLNARVPGEWDKRTALFSTGAEAVENAVKIASKHTGRPRVLVLDEAYHGRSLLTMAMTAKEHPYRTGFGPFPEDVVVRATNGNRLRSGLDTDEALAEVERVITEHGPEIVRGHGRGADPGRGRVQRAATRLPRGARRACSAARHRLRRRRDTGRTRPHRTHVRERARRRGGRSHPDGEGARRRDADLGGHRQEPTS